MLSSGILDTYWPGWRGGSAFSVMSFCLFILFMGFSRQECWSGFPFPSPVDNTFVRTLHHNSFILGGTCSMAHRFIKLCKAVVHVLILFRINSNHSQTLPNIEMAETLLKSLYDTIIILMLEPYNREGSGSPPQSSRLENPRDGGAWWAAVHGVAKSRTRLSDFTFPFHFHALEKDMATHSSVLAWRIPGTGEPSGLPSLGSHRVGHDWSNLAVAAEPYKGTRRKENYMCIFLMNIIARIFNKIQSNWIQHLLKSIIYQYWVEFISGTQELFLLHSFSSQNTWYSQLKIIKYVFKYFYIS